MPPGDAFVVVLVIQYGNSYGWIILNINVLSDSCSRTGMARWTQHNIKEENKRGNPHQYGFSM